MQHFVLRYLRRPSRRGHHHRHRTYHDAAAASSIVTSINWVRDRGLDHAVEKERDLKTMLNVKNLIKSEPSKSLPLSIISDNKESLGMPLRPIDFIRKYPSVFEEFLPGGIGIHPHVKLTPEILNLDAQEQLLFQTAIQKQDVADRLLKLLMMARINKIPLCVIDRLKWDLGLPHDYTQSVVPEFPDCFQVTSNGNELELVCWSNELAVSVMEKKSMTSFPLQYSRGFELNTKFKKWVDDWQKLPYISPYKNALHLQANSDESDKWVVALLHELLHLLVPKKTEKDNLLFLGEHFGVRSRFKRALLQHPGIFYVSSKLQCHTVVLREAYKRDLLVSKPQHPLMELRSKYIHLMNTVKKENKSKNAQVDGSRKHKAKERLKEGEDECNENKSKNVQVDGSRKHKAKEHLKEGEDECNDGESEHDEDDTDSEIEGRTDSDSNNDEIEVNNVVVNGRRPPLKHVPVRNGRSRSNDDFGEKEDYEYGNVKSRGRPSRNVKFNHNDSGGRSSFNSRDGRERGRGGRSRNKMFDSGSNERSDRRRGTRETNPQRDAKKSNVRSLERSGVSRGWERRC